MSHFEKGSSAEFVGVEKRTFSRQDAKNAKTASIRICGNIVASLGVLGVLARAYCLAEDSN
jgi:hypothetical protein